MENKKFIVSAAILFSIVFGILYYMVFTNFVQVHEAEYMHMNQVGLYKSSENANNMAARLKENGFDCFTMRKDDELIAVVCSLSDQEEETKAQQAKLEELGYTYIQKSVLIENPEIMDLLHNKEYSKALEMINNENKGTDAQ